MDAKSELRMVIPKKIHDLYEIWQIAKQDREDEEFPLSESWNEKDRRVKLFEQEVGYWLLNELKDLPF